MGKWLAGIASTVISALLIWFFTRSPQSPAPKPQPSLSGKWAYTMISDVSHNKYDGSLNLLMDGTNVAGEFLEDFFDTSNRGFLGALYGGNDLEFEREIKSKNTTQKFSLTKESDNRFAGKFWNDGPPVNTDSGTFEIRR